MHKDGPARTVASLVNVNSVVGAYGAAAMLDNGKLRLVMKPRALGKALKAIEELYTSAGLDDMAGTLMLPDAICKLEAYNSYINKLERLQEVRLGTTSGQGGVCAFSHVVRNGPKMVHATLSDGCTLSAANVSSNSFG